MARKSSPADPVHLNAQTSHNPLQLDIQDRERRRQAGEPTNGDLIGDPGDERRRATDQAGRRLGRVAEQVPGDPRGAQDGPVVAVAWCSCGRVRTSCSPYTFLFSACSSIAVAEPAATKPCFLENRLCMQLGIYQCLRELIDFVLDVVGHLLDPIVVHSSVPPTAEGETRSGCPEAKHSATGMPLPQLRTDF